PAGRIRRSASHVDPSQRRQRDAERVGDALALSDLERVAALAAREPELAAVRLQRELGDCQTGGNALCFQVVEAMHVFPPRCSRPDAAPLGVGLLMLSAPQVNRELADGGELLLSHWMAPFVVERYASTSASSVRRACWTSWRSCRATDAARSAASGRAVSCRS